MGGFEPPAFSIDARDALQAELHPRDLLVQTEDLNLTPLSGRPNLGSSAG